MVPAELRYTESHEWSKLEGNIVTVGITDFAQEQLSDIVFVELPAAGKGVKKGDECTVIESCKIAAELYAPAAGTIVAVNDALSSQPELVNSDPYGEGWMVKIELDNPAELDSLMDAAAYEKHLEASSH